MTDPNPGAYFAERLAQAERALAAVQADSNVTLEQRRKAERDRELALFAMLELARELERTRAEVAAQREFIAASKECSDAVTVAAVYEENERYRLAFAQAVASLKQNGVVRNAFCSWCEEVWPRLDGETPEEARRYAREHAHVCKAHPFRTELEQARTKVIEVNAEIFDHGYWHACSGCHESNEGHPTGPYSSALRCNLGVGCHECGGIGAIWEHERRNDRCPDGPHCGCPQHGGAPDAEGDE